ncbi:MULTISPECIES: hypothetical protein [Pseudomonas]|uniref:Uncharacterized protein n=1 Tax=Pseudomonas sessilinigenes TaxID=658629 RepID=A0ABX8MWB3_9PSED|nr:MULTISPECIES: hypothetical protein [Pseudomonas]AZC22489.1 hypothetical protein C4K39_0791 [Pseudomonas sessilinigenes]QXH41551.1 hypothetical protein KSS89_04840 [Pseudomonas sessilinigenes]UMZ12870.1 hypothetical protein I9018_03965 [Pseudomonas sp. MPFS]
MYPDDFNFSGYLKARVLTGDIDFSALVDALSERGYITEVDFPEGAGLCSSHMEALKQQEFDELFEFFYPRRINDIRLRCIATNEGGACPTGAYAYALINSRRLTDQEGLQILERENYLSEFSEHDLQWAREELLECLGASVQRLSDRDVQHELQRRQAQVLLIEGRLKALGVLPLSEEEHAWQALDAQFPNARSRDVVELEGVRYQRVFRPAQKDAEDKVTKWDKSWRRLGQASDA